jgi:hypothetical protein
MAQVHSSTIINLTSEWLITRTRCKRLLQQRDPYPQHVILLICGQNECGITQCKSFKISGAFSVVNPPNKGAGQSCKCKQPIASASTTSDNNIGGLRTETYQTAFLSVIMLLDRIKC